VQECEPLNLVAVPGLHEVHTIKPVVPEYEPTVQFLQFDWPWVSWKRPKLQSAHLVVLVFKA
jgi:hypothetical protein